MHFFLIALLFSISEAKNDSCSDNQFQCNDGRCITNDWICDGARDCSDGSDEMHNACVRHSNRNSPCFGNQPECEKHGSSRCIPHEWLCDGHPDCDKGEDEMNCTSIHWMQSPESLLLKYQQQVLNITILNISCSLQEFRCGKTGKCVNVKTICDGHNDCENGDDEKNCATRGIDIKNETMPSAFMNTSTQFSPITTKTANVTESSSMKTMKVMNTTIPTTTISQKMETVSKKVIHLEMLLTSPTTTTSITSTTVSKLISSSTTTPTTATSSKPTSTTTSATTPSVKPTSTTSTSTSTPPTSTTSSIPPPTTSISTTREAITRTDAVQPPKTVIKLLNDSLSNVTADKNGPIESVTGEMKSLEEEVIRNGRTGLVEPVKFVKGVPIEPVNLYNSTYDSDILG